MNKLLKLFLKEEMPEIVLEQHSVKIVRVIASCQNLSQLQTASGWIQSLVDSNDLVSEQYYEAFDLVILCQYHNIMYNVVSPLPFNSIKTSQWNLKVKMPAVKNTVYRIGRF